MKIIPITLFIWQTSKSKYLETSCYLGQMSKSSIVRPNLINGASNSSALLHTDTFSTIIVWLSDETFFQLLSFKIVQQPVTQYKILIGLELGFWSSGCQTRNLAPDSCDVIVSRLMMAVIFSITQILYQNISVYYAHSQMQKRSIVYLFWTMG